jgi:hypothetical protein
MLITDDVVPPETSPKILPSSVPSLWGYSPYHRARLRLRSYRLAIPDNLIYPWCHWGHTIREGADLPPRPPKCFLTCLPLNFQKIELPENRFVFFVFLFFPQIPVPEVSDTDPYSQGSDLWDGIVTV